MVGASFAGVRRQNQTKRGSCSPLTVGEEGRIASRFYIGWASQRGRLQSSVLHPVLVDGEIVQHLGDAAGGAGQQTLLLLAQQPPAGAGRHVAGDVLAGPGVEPGVEAPVQAGVDPLVRLEEIRRIDRLKDTSSTETAKWLQKGHRIKKLT